MWKEQQQRRQIGPQRPRTAATAGEAFRRMECVTRYDRRKLISTSKYLFRFFSYINILQSLEVWPSPSVIGFPS